MDPEWHSNPVWIIGKFGSSIEFICKKDQTSFNSRPPYLLHLWIKPSLNSFLKWVTTSFFLSQYCCVCYSFWYPQELDQCLAHGRHLKFLRNEWKCCEALWSFMLWYYYCIFEANVCDWLHYWPKFLTLPFPHHLSCDSAVLPTTDSSWLLA